MKAAVFHGPGIIKIEQKPKPPVDENSVSIRVKWSSLCGTDAHIYRGNFPVNPPLILGHDFSGTVDEVGANVSKVAVGDRAVAEPIRYCGACNTCLKGRYTVCDHRRIMGMHTDGSLAEFVVAPEKNVFPIPEKVSFEEAAMLEPASVALHSMDYAKPLPGEHIVILGQGPIGLLHTQVAKVAGLNVLAVEVNNTRIALSKRFGADHVVNPSTDDLKIRVMEITRGGADIVIDTTGSPKTVEITPHLTRNAGRILLVGSSEELMTHGPPSELILAKELSVYGVAGAPLKYPVSLALVADGKLDLESLITHRFKLDQIDEALKLLTSDTKLIKALVQSET